MWQGGREGGVWVDPACWVYLGISLYQYLPQAINLFFQFPPNSNIILGVDFRYLLKGTVNIILSDPPFIIVYTTVPFKPLSD